MYSAAQSPYVSMVAFDCFASKWNVMDGLPVHLTRRWCVGSVYSNSTINITSHCGRLSSLVGRWSGNCSAFHMDHTRVRSMYADACDGKQIFNSAAVAAAGDSSQHHSLSCWRCVSRLDRGEQRVPSQTSLTFYQLMWLCFAERIWVSESLSGCITGVSPDNTES